MADDVAGHPAVAGRGLVPCGGRDRPHSLRELPRDLAVALTNFAHDSPPSRYSPPSRCRGVRLVRAIDQAAIAPDEPGREQCRMMRRLARGDGVDAGDLERAKAAIF